MTKIKASYFSHDSNARNDEKILAVRMRHGAEGYGIYFMILERLRDESDYMIIKDYNLLAFDFRVSSDKVKSIVEDFGLFCFTDDKKYFFSEPFLERMEKKDELSQKNSENGKRGAVKRWKNSEMIANAIKNDSESWRTPQKKIASKVKESKEKKIPPLPPEGKPSSEKKIDFKKFTEAYNNLCTQLPKATAVTETRKRSIKARLKEHGEEKIIQVFQMAANSEFLNGNNGHNWKASFDWLMNPTNFVKVIEGNYKNLRENAKLKSTDPRASAQAGYDEPL
jgi:hypothetical protein